MDPLALASEFPAATLEGWRALVDKVLKGAEFERKLVGRTYDGVRIEPLYPKAEAAAQVMGRGAVPWTIAARLDGPDPAEANRLALADLGGGVGALTIVDAASPFARGFGLDAATVDALDRALAGVMLDLISVRLEAGESGGRAAALLLALCERRGHAPADLDLDLGLDPIGATARLGRMSGPWDVVGGRLSETLSVLHARGFAGRVALADGRPVHEAGGSEAQELGYVLASGLAYLRALEAGGHPLERARDALAFLLVADADEFLTVAKFRALRRLWARVEAACGLPPAPIRLHAETAWRATTQRDPWANVLRGTLAAFSAGIAGADTVAILPFTAALGLPDAFARRLARNGQTILLEEAQVWRVADPVAGAGGFEAVTEALAENAWSQLQAIEREGGVVASLSGGSLQRRVGAVRATREAAVRTRRDPITGTSEFPHPGEVVVSVLGVAAPADGASDAGSTPPGSPEPDAFAAWIELAADGAALPTGSVVGAAPALEPLPSRRSAEPFERLRDRSDAALAATGARPRVFLAPLGPVSAFSARATFARNAFEAGGIEASDSGGQDGFASLDALAAAFRASGTTLACLCSSDDVYVAESVAAATRLREAGARRLYLAGRPTALEDEQRRAGVTGYIHVGGDLVALLENAWAALREPVPKERASHSAATS